MDVERSHGLGRRGGYMVAVVVVDGHNRRVVQLRRLVVLRRLIVLHGRLTETTVLWVRHVPMEHEVIEVFVLVLNIHNMYWRYLVRRFLNPFQVVCVQHRCH
jgi:hypothetical protein